MLFHRISILIWNSYLCEPDSLEELSGAISGLRAAERIDLWHVADCNPPGKWIASEI